MCARITDYQIESDRTVDSYERDRHVDATDRCPENHGNPKRVLTGGDGNRCANRRRLDPDASAGPASEVFAEHLRKSLATGRRIESRTDDAELAIRQLRVRDKKNLGNDAEHFVAAQTYHRNAADIASGDRP